MKKILLMLLVVLGIVGCGGEDNKSATPEKKEVVLNLNLGEEGKTLDPQLTTDAPSFTLLSMIEDGLVAMDENLNFTPALAKSWDISEDGLTWTFHLRDNLKWSNGEPLTAADFKFAWLRALNPETASEYGYILYPIKNAEKYNSGNGSADEVGIKVVDDKTLEVTLESPTSYFDSLTAFGTYYPLNEKFFNEHKDDYALEPENMLYSGAYKMVSWTHNSNIVLEKNPYYYDADNVKIDKINIKYIGDPGAALNAFRNDEIDVVNLTAEQYDEFRNDPRVATKVQNVVWYLQYNNQIKALSNPKIRKAILLAIDKENIVNTVFKGVSNAAYSLTPANVGMKGINGDFIEEVGAKVPKYNVELAKELLAEGMKEEGITEMPTLSLLVNPSGSNKKVAEVIQEDLRKNLGINIEIEAKEFKERLARMSSGNFDLVYAGWGADYQDPLTYLDLFETTNGNNHGKYSNPEYDKLVNLVRKEVNNEKRVEYMRQIEEIIATDYPVGPLFNNTKIYLVNQIFLNYFL